MSERMGAISVCSSFRPSGPAALPGLSSDNCFATPLTDIVISDMAGKLRDPYLHIYGRSFSDPRLR